MIIKQRIYETCKTCGTTKMVKDEVHGCDTCGKEIDFNKRNVEHLELSIFNHLSDDVARIHVCSWKCAIKRIKKAIKNKECDYFISLPYLNFNSKAKGLTYKDFLKELK